MLSSSALRLTRSACASCTLEEWLFTPMPSCSQRSRSSLLESPSSFASSCTRGFLGKEVPNACRFSGLLPEWAVHELRRTGPILPPARRSAGLACRQRLCLWLPSPICSAPPKLSPARLGGGERGGGA